MVIPFRTILPNIKSIYAKDASININNNMSNNIGNSKGINGTDVKHIMNNKLMNSYNSNNRIQTKDYSNNNSIVLFKYKDKSRFFNDKSNNNKSKDVNENIPDNILNLIDELFLRFPFFKQFDKFLSLKKYELGYCKSKYQNINDSWFDFIFKNTN